MSRRHHEEHSRDRRGHSYSRNQRHERESLHGRNHGESSRYQQRERSPRSSHRNQQDYNDERSNFYTPNRGSRPQNLDNRERFDLNDDDEDESSPYSEYLRHNNRNSRSERQHSYADSPNYNRFNEDDNARMNTNASFQVGGGGRNYYDTSRQGTSLPNWSQAPMLAPHYLEAASIHSVEGTAPPQGHFPVAGRPQEHLPYGGQSQGRSPYTGQPQEHSHSAGHSQGYVPFARRRFNNITCFNCARKGHSIGGCPRPRNYRMIEFNKFRFNQRKGSFRNAKRYHETDMMRDIQPGNISEALRKSLGLKENQLPKFIYNMRTFGYPTAWLREAVIVPSSMTIIDTKKSDKPTDSNNVSYDINKLISFPGFNAPPPPGTIDESKLHDAPAYDQDQDISVMIQVIEEGRKECDNTEDEHIVQKEDLDKDLQDQKLSNDGEKSKKEKVSKDLLEEVSQDETSFNEGETSFGKGALDVEVAVESSEREAKHSGEGLKHNFHASGSESLNDLISERSDLNQISNTFINRKKASLGPVIKPLSPFKQLPPMVNFADGVSDVVPFENLPDATGTFGNMKSILQKVKNAVKKTT